MISRMTKKESATYLRIGLTKLDELRSSGKIAPIIDGGRVFYEQQELERYHNSLRVRPENLSDVYGTYRKRRGGA